MVCKVNQTGEKLIQRKSIKQFNVQLSYVKQLYNEDVVYLNGTSQFTMVLDNM